MTANRANEIGILKSIWRRNESGKWVINDLKGVNLKPRDGLEQDYFKIKSELVLLTERPGSVMNNLFGSFGTTEYLIRQSIVPIVAWNEGDDEMRCIGTGFFISASGLLITAAHVLRDPLDKNYAGLTEIDENLHRLGETLHFGVMLPANPAARNAPFDVHPALRAAKWFMCPFEWTCHWGNDVESPLVHEKPQFKLLVDVAVCKVGEQPLIGPFQPLNIGHHSLKVGDRAVAIGYAEMKNIKMKGDDYEPELVVSVGSVRTIYSDNIRNKENSTPGPNFEFDARIPGEGILTKGVVSRSWQDENSATGCLIAPMMSLPLIDGKNLRDLQRSGDEGIALMSGRGL